MRLNNGNKMKSILITMLLVFTYTAENGTLCFTDSLDNVPTKYISKVVQREVGTLQDYNKFSSESKARPTVVPVNIRNSYGYNVDLDY